MEVRIHGSNSFSVSPKMRSYIMKKIEKLHYFKQHIQEINFHFTIEKLINKISATVTVPKIQVYKFEASAPEMYSAIDKIVHKMDIKINKEKSKIQNHNNPNHQEIVNYFYDDKEDKQEESVKNIDFINKPTTLLDAYLQMEVNNNDFYGFNLLDENQKIAPAFLRKLDDDVVSLFKKDGIDQYIEFSLIKEGNQIKIDQKQRELILKEMNIIEAQKDILNQDFPYNIFIDKEKKIHFLCKVGNGKWNVVS